MRTRLAAIVVLTLCASAAIAETPKANTRREIKKYVHAAAKHIAAHGPSCNEFARKEWRSGDYYIFVLGPDKKTLCHPDPTMIGRPASEIVDANGKKVGEMIAAAGMKMRGGWVDYVWPRPGITKPVPKSTYAEHVRSPDGDIYIVGSGGYEIKQK
ncbi:MAG: hypothetical protein DMF58_12280 [Acidobacteria bacterium]|nr:MAG: hypothetical protein DMF58_12280 [Acidobacteriota bacterium]